MLSLQVCSLSRSIVHGNKQIKKRFIVFAQTKLNAISPVPDTSETGTSGEFNFSGLALPVPLEFADTDSLQDVPIDVFDEDPETRDQLTG